MKKLIKTISNHKVITTTICGVFALALVGVIGYNQYKINNTYKALELGEDGIITSEELSEIGEIALGETITTLDGQQIVVTQDADGNYIVTPQNPTTPGGNTPSPTPDPTPTPAHQHVWVAHYSTIHHDAVTQQVMVSPAGTYCNTCGACVTGDHGKHAHETGHGGTHSQAAQYETKVIAAAYDEQVIDYYYCSDCGARQ